MLKSKNFHQHVFHQGGLSSGCLSLGWSLIRVVSHQGGLLSGWSFNRGSTVVHLIRVKTSNRATMDLVQEPYKRVMQDSPPQWWRPGSWWRQRQLTRLGSLEMGIEPAVDKDMKWGASVFTWENFSTENKCVIRQTSMSVRLHLGELLYRKQMCDSSNFNVSKSSLGITSRRIYTDPTFHTSVSVSLQELLYTNFGYVNLHLRPFT